MNKNYQLALEHSLEYLFLYLNDGYADEDTGGEIYKSGAIYWLIQMSKNSGQGNWCDEHIGPHFTHHEGNNRIGKFLLERNSVFGYF